MERVQIARIGDIRRRLERLLGPEEPHLVGRRTLDRRPADEPRMRAVEILRDARPANVESIRRAPGGDALARDRPDVCVQRVRRAGDPGQGEIDGHGRRAQVRVELCELGGGRLRGRRRCRGGRSRCRRCRCNKFVVRVRPDDRALRERPAGRKLELVADRAADGQPRKGGRAVEFVLHGLVAAEQERLQPLRRDRRPGRPVDSRLGDAAEGEREHAENGEQKKTTDRNHHQPFIGRCTVKL